MKRTSPLTFPFFAILAAAAACSAQTNRSSAPYWIVVGVVDSAATPPCGSLCLNVFQEVVAGHFLFPYICMKPTLDTKNRWTYNSLDLSISHTSPTTRLCVDASTPPLVHLADCDSTLPSQRWSLLNSSFLRNDQGFFLQSPLYDASRPKPSDFAKVSVSTNLTTSSPNLTSLFTLVPFSIFDTYVAENSGGARANFLQNPGFENVVPPFSNLSVDGSFLFSVCDWVVGNSLTILDNSSTTVGSFSLSLFGYGLISQAIRTKAGAQYLLSFQMNYNRSCTTLNNQTLLQVQINDSSTLVLQDIAIDPTDNQAWESVHMMFVAATNVVRLGFQGRLYDGNVGPDCKSSADTGPTLDNVEVYFMNDGIWSSGRETGKSSSHILKIVLAPVILGSILLGALGMVVFYKRSKRKKYDDVLLVSKKRNVGGALVLQPRQFSLLEVQELTRNFSDELLIGEGGFGKVFRVSLKQSPTEVKAVAVKRGFKESQTARTRKLFEMELSTLLRVHHCHVLDFIGYCDDQDEMILLTEYMEGGSLHQQLHELKNKDLTWHCRMSVAYQVACGLNYLHHGATPPILHLDIKPANILLTSDLSIAKVADFGICKITHKDIVTNTQFRGTVGYADPQFFNTGRASNKTDVYSYGILLLELLTGKCASRGDHYDPLHIWAGPFLSHYFVDEDIKRLFLDPNLRGTPMSEVRSVMEVVRLCLLTSMDRPSMFQLLNMFLEKLPWVVDINLNVNRSSSEDGYVEPFSILTGR